MAAKPLEQFVLEESDTGYLITIQAEGGQSLTVEVSPDQMDAIIDALDDLLSDDDLDGLDLGDDEEE